MYISIDVVLHREHNSCQNKRINLWPETPFYRRTQERKKKNRSTEVNANQSQNDRTSPYTCCCCSPRLSLVDPPYPLPKTTHACVKRSEAADNHLSVCRGNQSSLCAHVLREPTTRVVVFTWSRGMHSVLAATEVAVVSSSTSPSLRASARESFFTFSSHSVSLQNGVSTMSFLPKGKK